MQRQTTTKKRGGDSRARRTAGQQTTFSRSLWFLEAVTLVATLVVAVFVSRSAGDNGSLTFAAWPTPDALYLVDGPGHVHFIEDRGRTLQQRGQIGGEPATFHAQGRNELYVALHDGTIKRSTDAGVTRTERSRP